MLRLVTRRALAGLATLVAVSVLIFVATEVLPGNAATAMLGQTATPERVQILEEQLHLNKTWPQQYTAWARNILTGNLGVSLVNGRSVWSLVEPALVNSAVLVALAGIIGTLLAVLLGVLAAVGRDGLFDQIASVVALALTSLPEFIIGIALVTVFATVVSHLLPAVSTLPPGTHPWDEPTAIVLPVATLVIVITPYIFRMARASMIEALDSEYVETARLNGVHPLRIILAYALPNAFAPTIQVIGLTLLYLAGGIVFVEYVFSYPGMGQALVNAVNARDVPTVQFIVLILAAFYLIVNVVTDVLALMSVPRRRIPRS
jgi:peptide/nickel transport system permease protein